MKALAQILTRAVLAAALLIPAAALADGFGRAPSPAQRAKHRLQAISAQRQIQVKRDGLEIRRTLRRLSDEAAIRRSGSPAGVERYARSARLRNAIDDQFLREDLRRDWARTQGQRSRALVRTWGRPLPGLVARERLADTLVRRRFLADVDLKLRSQDLAQDVARGLARELARRKRAAPQILLGDSKPSGLRRLLPLRSF
ncbi:MAG: hypothetical protein JRG96_18935 [Deltaproteobacteria bacterium]|nr:hypothetical protein [Deltaproteobacteria bacterium]MBW2418678.1 hypothetical protein [Deltaproteobacteria bacterium]